MPRSSVCSRLLLPNTPGCRPCSPRRWSVDRSLRRRALPTKSAKLFTKKTRSGVAERLLRWGSLLFLAFRTIFGGFLCQRRKFRAIRLENHGHERGHHEHNDEHNPRCNEGEVPLPSGTKNDHSDEHGCNRRSTNVLNRAKQFATSRWCHIVGGHTQRVIPSTHVTPMLSVAHRTLRPPIN